MHYRLNASSGRLNLLKLAANLRHLTSTCKTLSQLSNGVILDKKLSSSWSLGRGLNVGRCWVLVGFLSLRLEFLSQSDMNKI